MPDLYNSVCQKLFEGEFAQECHQPFTLWLVMCLTEIKKIVLPVTVS